MSERELSERDRGMRVGGQFIDGEVALREQKVTAGGLVVVGDDQIASE